MKYQFSKNQIEDYKNNGYLVCKDFFKKKDIKNLIKWTDEVENFEETRGKWMKYYDPSLKNKRNFILTRIENFIEYHNKFKKFILSKKILKELKKIFGSEVVLFKDKINFKYPGSKGFKAHQDATIWKGMYGIKSFFTMVVSIDHSNKKNGRLEIAKKKDKIGLIGDGWKEMPKKIENKISWTPINTAPGDLIFFNDYTPHRSSNNLSNKRRRMLFLTFNNKNNGNHKTKHFKDKRKNFPPNFERETGKRYIFHI
jgi:2-aminoethylphosphonate dioxygenase